MQNQPNHQSGLNAGREGRSGEGASKLADKAGQAADQVKSAAVEKVQAVREQAQTGLKEGRHQVADRIRHVSSALKSAGDNLRQEDEFIARYVEQAGDRIEGIAGYVSNADPRDILNDVQDFARQRPAWFFGGAFLLGLAAGRFLKASVDAGDDALELSDNDLEDISMPRYGRQPYRRPPVQSTYGSDPITPAATIPVTQTIDTGAARVAPPSPSPTTTAPMGTPQGASSGTSKSSSEFSSDIFDPSLPGSLPGSKNT